MSHEKLLCPQEAKDRKLNRIRAIDVAQCRSGASDEVAMATQIFHREWRLLQLATENLAENYG